MWTANTDLRWALHSKYCSRTGNTDLRCSLLFVVSSTEGRRLNTAGSLGSCGVGRRRPGGRPAGIRRSERGFRWRAPGGMEPLFFVVKGGQMGSSADGQKTWRWPAATEAGWESTGGGRRRSGRPLRWRGRGQLARNRCWLTGGRRTMGTGGRRKSGAVGDGEGASVGRVASAVGRRPGLATVVGGRGRDSEGPGDGRLGDGHGGKDSGDGDEGDVDESWERQSLAKVGRGFGSRKDWGRSGGLGRQGRRRATGGPESCQGAG